MEFKKFLIESGLARTYRILYGDVPYINTIGIITAWNPKPPILQKKPSKKENQNRNKELKKYLKDGHYNNYKILGPIKIRGEYEGTEQSYLIPNITRENLIRLAQKFDQFIVIFGEKTIEEENPKFNWQWIERQPDGNYVTTKESEKLKIDPDRKDFYSKIGWSKGEKEGESEIKNIGGKPIEKLRPSPRRGKFVIDFDENEFYIDDLITEEIILNFCSDKLPKTQEIQELVKKIKTCQQDLAYYGENGVFGWSRRGIIKESLEKLKKLNEKL